MGNMFFETSLTSGDFAFLAVGALKTLGITALAVIFGTVFGAALGILRAEAGWMVNTAIAALVDVLRSVPLLIQLIIFNSFVAIIGFPMSAFASGVVVLSLYTAANTTEVARAGIEAVPQQMRRAGRSLGMSYRQDLWHVVLPVGARAVFPSWIGVVLAIMKDSALVSVLGYFELLKSSQVLITRTQEPMFILLLVGGFYFAMGFPISRLAARLEKTVSQ